MQVRNAIGVNLVGSESKVCLLRVQVNIRGNGCVYLSINFLTQWEPSDEISSDDLSGSLRYGDWKCSRFRVRNRLETLTLFIASDVFVDEGIYEQPPVVTLDQFQGKVIT